MGVAFSLITCGWEKSKINRCTKLLKLAPNMENMGEGIMRHLSGLSRYENNKTGEAEF